MIALPAPTKSGDSAQYYYLTPHPHLNTGGQTSRRGGWVPIRMRSLFRVVAKAKRTLLFGKDRGPTKQARAARSVITLINCQAARGSADV